MSLKCCNKFCQIIKSVPLYDTEQQKHRVLAVGRCKNSKCGCIKAEFIYYDIVKGKFIHHPIATDKVAEVVEAYEKAPYLAIFPSKTQYGTIGNMYWKYQKNGCKYDFNGLLLEKLDREVIIYND